MGLLDFLKRITTKRLENKSIVKYFIDEDVYTGLIRYYECTITNQDISVKILETCPKGYEELNSSTSKHIQRAIQHCNNDFCDSFTQSENFFQIEKLYQLSHTSGNKDVAEVFNKYLDLKKRILQKCSDNRISCKTDKQEIISEIIDRIEETYRNDTREKGLELSSSTAFCKTRASIDKELEKEKEGRFNSQIFSNARNQIILYLSHFIEQLPWLLKILNKKRLTQPEKIFLSRYSEIMECLPDLVELLNYLEECETIIRKGKQNNQIKRFKSRIY